MPRIARALAEDLRFPTSRALDGSEAMTPAPDCSAAYLVLETGDGRQRPTAAPAFSVETKAESRARHRFPGGAAWADA